MNPVSEGYRSIRTNIQYHNPNKDIKTEGIIAGDDKVYVSRIRVDESKNNSLNMWIVSDNLRKGAALNTIQIAETIIEKNLI